MKRKGRKRLIVEAVVLALLFAASMLVLPDDSKPGDFTLTTKQRKEVVSRWDDQLSVAGR